METEQGSSTAIPATQDISPPDALLSNPWATPRKRRYGDSTMDGDVPRSGYPDDNAETTFGQGSKRSRSSRWAQENANDEPDRASRGHRTRQRYASPQLKRNSNSNSTPRSSKFLEGSMNDRTSKKPPSPYLGEDKAMEEHTSRQAASTRESVDTNTFYDAGIESNKPSSMVRFGKAFASAFNPSAWRGLGSIWKEKDKQNVDPGKALMNERQEKAQKAYAELKKSGYKGIQGSSKHPMNEIVPAFKFVDDSSTQGSQSASFRDSAIDIDEYRSSIDHREDLRSLVNEEDLMPAPNVPLVSRAISPMPTTTGRRSSLALRTPSFQTLKKATSHIQLPSVKRHSTQSEASDSSQQVKKQPSKKDLAKQQKLVKRVSNLENQLETARHELELALASAPANGHVEQPAKKAFKPGALPSLPSERILNAHVNEQEVYPENNESGYMQTRSATKNSVATQDPTSQLYHELEGSTPAKTSRKRKSKPSIEQVTAKKPDQFDDYEIPSESTPAKTPARRPGRPRKTPKVEAPTIPMPARPLRRTSSLAHTTPPQELRRPSTLRTRKHKIIPPVPSLPEPVSPSQVDKAAILSMRSVPDTAVPFGDNPEDLINLRKIYPLLSDTQVAALLGNLQLDAKATDYTSTAHHGRPASQALAPPSPIKSQHSFKPSISKSSLRSSKQEPKAPNNSPVEVRGTYGTRGRSSTGKFVKIRHEAEQEEQGNEEEGDTVADLSPSKTGKELPPYPKNSAEQEGEKMKEVENEKQLPSVQREDYNWDEDVF